MDDIVFTELLNGIKEALGELKDSQKEIQLDIKDIKNTQVSQQIIQAEQHLTLVDHTKRSTANEEEIKLVRDSLQRQILPLQKDNWKMKGALGLLGLILTVITILSLLHKV